MSYANCNTKSQPKAKSQQPKPKAKAKSQKPKPKAKSQSQKPKANQRFWLQIRDFGSKMQQIARKTAPDWKTKQKSYKKNRKLKIYTLPSKPSSCRLRQIFRRAAHGAQRQLELRTRDAAVLAKLWSWMCQALQVGHIHIDLCICICVCIYIYIYVYIYIYIYTCRKHPIEIYWCFIEHSN